MSREVTYSEIIAPGEYNRIMTEQHLYIKKTDEVIKEMIKETQQEKGRILEIVEIGCGPARATMSVRSLKGIHLTCIDHDKKFVDYAKKKLRNFSIEIKLADIENYYHGKKVDIFFSQGVHHHLSKPPIYLKNLKKQLSRDGCYILSDEFLPNYNSQYERRVKAVVWYSHIIASAVKGHHKYLAKEEAKTLLDELNTMDDETRIKTKKQINLVLTNAVNINKLALRKDVYGAEKLAVKFLNELSKIYNFKVQKDPRLDLSRGDYKICDKVLKSELKKYGFKVEMVKRIGPFVDIGGLCVYIIQRN